jgi:DNA (cytosine-5)-methyltransferase 1
MIKVGSDFSGVGTFDQALRYLGIEYKSLFVCDMDKHVRQTYELNYGKPAYYPEDVYDREIPVDPLDIYMTSPPCQGFSIAGLRNGSILFFNSHEFIKKNRPRFFIFENVKGLLSHHDKEDKAQKKGYTFSQWVAYLGGKSVNGNPTIFPHDESVPYHIYYSTLNALDYTIPQNRERVFIIGIRDDEDNNFDFPKPVELKKRLRDVLEPKVDEKYYLSEKMLAGLIAHTTRHQEAGHGFKLEIKNGDDIANCILNRVHKMGPCDNYVEVESAAVRGRDPDNPKSRKKNDKGYVQMLEVNDRPDISNTLTSVEKDNLIVESYYQTQKDGIEIKSNTEKGFDLFSEGDSLDYKHPNSKTRRGRIGKEIAQTLDTECKQAVIEPAPTLMQLFSLDGDKNAQANRVYDSNGVSVTITGEAGGGGAKTGLYLVKRRIRRLTPRECFRLMGFPDEFRWECSDTQAYRQAGNAIVMHVLAAIINKLPL